MRNFPSHSTARSLRSRRSSWVGTSEITQPSGFAGSSGSVPASIDFQSSGRYSPPVSAQRNQAIRPLTWCRGSNPAALTCGTSKCRVKPRTAAEIVSSS